MHSAEAFQRFAASCHFVTHGYLDVQEETLVYDQNQVKPASASLDQVTRLAIRAFQERPTYENQEALKLFRAHLVGKSQSYFYGIYSSAVHFDSALHQIDTVLEKQRVLMGSEETVFRLRFLSELPLSLGVRHAPKTQVVTIQWLNGETTSAVVKEWEIIAWLSKQIYRSEAVATAAAANRWTIYSEMMIGAYKGDHILISDDQEHHLTQELIALGAIVRVSSHNEKGRVVKGWNKAGAPIFKGDRYEDIKSLSDKDHHWSLEGDHVCEILFYAADMRKRKDGTLIYAKTARQVDHLIRAGKLKSEEIDQETEHHYTAIQFEFAPDCEGKQLLNWKYWEHKVFSSYVYRLMKHMGYENANVGPYGFGRTDMNPRVINKL